MKISAVCQTAKMANWNVGPMVVEANVEHAAPCFLVWMVFAHVFQTAVGNPVEVTDVVAHAVRVPLAHANPTENVNALQYALRKNVVIATLRLLQQVATSRMRSK